MVAYEFYWFDQEGKYQIIGVLPERRKRPKRITQESIMCWGKDLFGKDSDLKEIFFTQIFIDEDTGKISRRIPFFIIEQ